MSKDTFLTTYVAIPEDTPGAKPGEELEITLRYQEGGINYFNYKHEKRGLYLHMVPVTRSRTSHGSMMTSRSIPDHRACKVMVSEMGRRNAKYCTTVADGVTPLIDAIASRAMHLDWLGVAHILEEANLRRELA